MNRLLAQKVKGKWPFQYVNAASTSLAETFRRIRAEQKEQQTEPQKVTSIKRGAK